MGGTALGVLNTLYLDKKREQLDVQSAWLEGEQSSTEDMIQALKVSDVACSHFMSGMS